MLDSRTQLQSPIPMSVGWYVRLRCKLYMEFDSTRVFFTRSPIFETNTNRNVYTVVYE